MMHGLGMRFARWQQLSHQLLPVYAPTTRSSLHFLTISAWNVDSGQQPCYSSTQDLQTTSRLHKSSPLVGVHPRRAFSQTTPPTEKCFNLARDVVQPLALTQGEKSALIFTNGTDHRHEVSYKELFEDSLHLATGLSVINEDSKESKKSGGCPKIALVVLPKIPAWWVINVAASWGGMAISPGTPLLTQGDVEYRLAESGADCVFCGPHLVPGFDQAEDKLGKRGQLLKVVVGSQSAGPRHANLSSSGGWVRYEDLVSTGASVPSMPCHNTQLDDVCQLFFTSGTTGKPKMVPHTHHSYGMGHHVTASKWLGLREDDVLWNVSDAGWAKAAWSSLYTPFIAKATAFIHQMERFDPEVLLEALVREPVSVLCAPPTAYRALVQLPLERYKFSRLRHCVTGGEPLNPEVWNTWMAKTGVPVYEGYGQSETTLVCATLPGMTIKPGCIGKPAPGYDVRVVDQDLQELPTGQEGQLAIKTEPSYPVGLFRGYKNDPERTKSVFQGGYYLTGDRGYYDQDGYLCFVARTDDEIISSGYRIGPFEVESALLEHPSVVEAGVVGVPDPLRGHAVKAFVVLTKEAATATEGIRQKEEELVAELQSHVKAVTAPYKYPRQIEFVKNLPKTVSGKIRRVELRQRPPAGGRQWQPDY